jgi:hypothetical protein
MLIYAEMLGILGKRENCRIVFFDKAAQVTPHGRKGRGKIDVALPQPGHLPIGKLRDKWQRLRIVNNDRVALFEMKSRCILKYDFFVYGSFSFRQI